MLKEKFIYRKDPTILTKQIEELTRYQQRKQNLENDLIIEFKDSTIHILNSISPAWTCAFKTAQFILNYLNEI